MFTREILKAALEVAEAAPGLELYVSFTEYAGTISEMRPNKKVYYYFDGEQWYKVDREEAKKVYISCYTSRHGETVVNITKEEEACQESYLQDYYELEEAYKELAPNCYQKKNQTKVVVGDNKALGFAIADRLQIVGDLGVLFR